jgi:Mg2+/Co2+ transporter CorB
MNKTIDEIIDSQRERYFGKTILNLMKQMNVDEIMVYNQKLAASLPVELTTDAEAWIDEITSMGYNKSFWKDETTEIFSIISNRASDRMRLHGLVPDKENIRILRNMAALNFIYTGWKNPASKAFIQKSIGIGLFGRLFD